MSLQVKVRKAGGGIIVETNKGIYALDKAEGIRADYHIISHAHSDHVPKLFLGKLVASRETIDFLKYRVRLPKIAEEHTNIELINSGHILGSRAALIENDILYTGDVNLRSRLFMQGFNPPQAKILIIEATYGDPKFKFDRFDELVNKANEEISELLCQGRNIAAIGYSLGKSQILTKIFSWYEHLYVTRSVNRYNSIYEKFGVNFDVNYKELKGEPKKPFIIIGYTASNEIRIAIKKFGAIPIKFTGWALLKGNSRDIPISDHADFYDLLRLVDRVNPEKIYVAYGFTNRFAKILKNLGYDAEAL